MALMSPRFKSSATLNRVAANVARLQTGSAGRAVHLIQMALLDLGYAMPNSTANLLLSPDGVYGEETKRVVKQFQKDRRTLIDDGVVGQKTLQELDRRLNTFSHRVRLHLKSLGMPSVPEFTALRNAQSVYGQYGISIEFVSGQSLPNAVDRNSQCLSLVAVDVGSCTIGQTMTPQQNTLFNYGSRQGVGPNDILCYWVNRVESGGSDLAGCASHPTAQPACVISALGSPWTLAHEVGHVLGLRHKTGTRMLMSTPTALITANPPAISAADLAIVRASRLCVPC